MFSLRRFSQISFIFGIYFLSVFIGFSQNVSASSVITGTVYDKQRNTLPNMEVELLNDFYQMEARTTTDGSGRYQFSGLSNGRYSVKVYAFRYELEDQTLPIEINTQNVRGGEGSGYFQLDFYLSPKKGGLNDFTLGVVFAQDVPADAEKLYEQAIRNFSKNQTDEGILALNKSIKIFPDYFLALHRIGKELFIKKQYSDAIPYFLKAAEVNSKSASAYYYLGYSLSRLGKDYNKSAITSLNQAFTLAPASMQILFALGKVERSEGQFENAEKHLLQAKKVSGGGISEIHKELAQLYANDLKRYKEAANELELYLKASKLKGADEKKTKKIINDLREKAKTQSIGN